jgi:hypothetical protein
MKFAGNRMQNLVFYALHFVVILGSIESWLDEIYVRIYDHLVYINELKVLMAAWNSSQMVLGSY